MSILCLILHRTVDHCLAKTIGQFVYLTVQVNLKCKWNSRDIESIKCGTIGIKPFIQILSYIYIHISYIGGLLIHGGGGQCFIKLFRFWLSK